MKLLFLLFLVAAMTASVTARTAKEAHDLAHETWKKELAAGGDYSEMSKIYAEDVVVDFRAYEHLSPTFQPFYKGRDNIAVWLTAIANSITAMPRFEWTYEFGDGTEKSSIATHRHLGSFKGRKGFENFKTYCTYEMNDDGLVSHVGYAIAEHQRWSDLNAQQNHDAAVAAWFRATASGNYDELVTLFADDIKVVWMPGFFDLDENEARFPTDVFHGVEEATAWIKATGAALADVKKYDTPYTYGMSEDGRNTITNSHMVLKETGADYYISAHWYMTWTVNDDGLLSEAIYTFRNKKKVGDGACAADGTCPSVGAY